MPIGTLWRAVSTKMMDLKLFAGEGRVRDVNRCINDADFDAADASAEFRLPADDVTGKAAVGAAIGMGSGLRHGSGTRSSGRGFSTTRCAIDSILFIRSEVLIRNAFSEKRLGLRRVHARGRDERCH